MHCSCPCVLHFVSRFSLLEKELEGTFFSNFLADKLNYFSNQFMRNKLKYFALKSVKLVEEFEKQNEEDINRMTFCESTVNKHTSNLTDLAEVRMDAIDSHASENMEMTNVLNDKVDRVLDNTKKILNLLETGEVLCGQKKGLNKHGSA